MVRSIIIPDTNLRFIKSHNFKNLIGAIGQKTLVVLQIKDSSLITKLRFVDENEEEYYTCLDFLDYNDDVFIVIGGVSGIIKILDAKSGNFYSFIDAHTEITHLTVFKTTIITCSTDTTIKMWDFNTLKCLNTLTGHEDVVLKLSLQNNLLLSVGMDQKILVWDLDKITTYRPNCIIKDTHRDLILKCLFYGELVVILSRDSKIAIFKPLFNEKKSFFLLKTLHYEGTVDIDIVDHLLICLSHDLGIFSVNLLTVFDETPAIKNFKTFKNEGISLTCNKKYIFCLYDDNLIEGYLIDR